MQKERFVKCHFNSNYLIGSKGSVKSFYKLKTGSLLKGSPRPDGYVAYFLKTADHLEGRWFFAHRLVAAHYCFNSNPFASKEVNHKDGNRSNNYWQNLEWCTRSENLMHSYRHLGKTPPKGMLGKEHSAQTRQLMSDLKRGELHPRFKGYYIIHGQRYASSREAGTALGMAPASVYKNCIYGKRDGYSFQPASSL